MDEPIGDLPCFALGLFLLKRVDKFDGGEEAHPLAMMFDSLHAERRCDVRLAGSRPADEHDVVGIGYEVTAMQLAHESFVDLAAGEVEAGKIAVGWEARCLELIS